MNAGQDGFPASRCKKPLVLNTRGLVKNCIKNAKASAGNIQYEIIVVDNGSYDGVEQMLKDEYPDVQFVQNPKNAGFGAGNNLGFSFTKGEYIMVLTPDVTALGNSIPVLLKYMKEHPEIGLAGPKLMNPDESIQTSCRTFQTPKLIAMRRTPLGLVPKYKKMLDDHLMAAMDRTQPQEVDWVTGACMIASRSAIKKVGGFDERFFFYVEDMEWCRRFWMHGYKVCYVPQAEMIHLWERASMNDLWSFVRINRWARLHIISWIKYYLKYIGIQQHGREQIYY